LKRNAVPRLAAAVLLLAALPAAAGQISDKIWLRGTEEPQVVQITEETIDGIKAGAVSFSLKAVVRVQYGDGPFAYREAEQHEEQARYEEAIRLYETALRDQVCQRRWWLEPACKYRIALCQLESGELDEAVKSFQKLLAEHANTRWKLDALLGLGRVYFDKKQYGPAITQFKELATLAAQKQFEEWGFRANLWEAKALREDGKLDDALQLIQKIVGAATGDRYEDIYIAARTEEAVILMAKGKYDEAVELLGKLVQRIGTAVAKEIESGGETRVQQIESVCFNTLGQCYLQMGNKAGDDNKKKGYYHEALLSFLWTVVLYQRLPAQHAEALFHAAECFEKLGQRTRADELRNECIQRYPDSPFGRRLRPAERAAGR